MRYGGICLAVVAGLFVLVGGGCRKDRGPKMDSGRFEGPVYHNDYLGMTITVPAEWTIQDRQTAQQMMRRGEKMIAGSNENMAAALEAGEAKTVNLFTAFKYLPGSPVPYNPSFYGVAESIAHAPGIKTGADYLFHARRLLETGQMKFTFPREVYAETVAGVEFHVMTTEFEMPPAGKVNQEYYAAVRKGYVLLFTLSYTTDEERTELHKILDTLTLTQPPATKQ